MTSHILLKYGDLKTDLKQKGHEGEIVLDSFSWGASNPLSNNAVTGLSGGTPTAHEVVITKTFDAVSAKLLGYLLSGNHNDKAVITFLKTTGEKGQVAQDYLIIKLNGTMLSSYSVAGTKGGDGEQETFTFAFEKLELDYKSQDSTGKLTTAASLGWDGLAGEVK